MWKLRLGEWLFQKRDFTPIPFIALAIFMIQPTPFSVILGMHMITLGAAIRFWGVGHIGGISRTRSRSTGDLVDTGPFSICRNPLYVGNFFLSTGFVVGAGAWTLVPLFIALFAFQYHFIVLWEESNLREKFGAPYDEYCRTVPRWFPKFRNYRPGETDWEKAKKSERMTWAAMIAVGLFLLVGMVIF